MNRVVAGSFACIPYQDVNISCLSAFEWFLNRSPTEQKWRNCKNLENTKKDIRVEHVRNGKSREKNNTNPREIMWYYFLIFSVFIESSQKSWIFFVFMDFPYPCQMYSHHFRERSQIFIFRSSKTKSLGKIYSFSSSLFSWHSLPIFFL